MSFTNQSLFESVIPQVKLSPVLMDNFISLPSETLDNRRYFFPLGNLLLDFVGTVFLIWDETGIFTKTLKYPLTPYPFRFSV